MLGNLLDNACKHCRRTIRIDAAHDDDRLQIGIHDDGEGIEPSYRATLLQRGRRADSRHTGQGIGLDVARDIVASYRGELTIAESRLGGALFLITLPA